MPIPEIGSRPVVAKGRMHCRHLISNLSARPNQSGGGQLSPRLGTCASRLSALLDLLPHQAARTSSVHDVMAGRTLVIDEEAQPCSPVVVRVLLAR